MACLKLFQLIIILIFCLALTIIPDDISVPMVFMTAASVAVFVSIHICD